MKNGGSTIEPDRDFARELGQELEAIRAGIAEALPDSDWTPYLLLGRISAVADLFGLFNRELLADLGLAPVEQQVLGILRSQVADSPAELSRFTHQTRAGMTRTLDRLEQRGLVRRRPHPTDRRRTRISLTKKGLNLADRKLAVELAALEGLLGGLDRNARARISGVLDELAARLAGARRTTGSRAA
jgi:DNA-binding MarR family transcriptional regulator